MVSKAPMIEPEADVVEGMGQVDETALPSGEELENTEENTAAETSNDAQERGRVRSRREVLAESSRRAQEWEQRNAVRQQFLAGWAGLQSAMRREHIMYGVVSSIDEMPLKDTASEYLHTGIFVTIIHNNTYKIRIPFQSLYRRFPVDMRTVDLYSEEGVRSFILRQRAMAEKLYGLSIPFVIDYMDADRISPNEDYAISTSRAKSLFKIFSGKAQKRRE